MWEHTTYICLKRHIVMCQAMCPRGIRLGGVAQYMYVSYVI